MKSVKVTRLASGLSGTLSFPGDKSLSHRAVIFGSLAEGVCRFTNVSAGEDCVRTRKAFEQMGVKIDPSKDGTELTIHGVGLNGLKEPKKELYLGNSGTSMRLLMGLLAGQPFSATLTGDPSLSSRPMKRVTEPLRRMGAKIEGKDDGNFAPMTIHGSKLKGIDCKSPISSAQVKSAVLLAGLYAERKTSFTEPEKSRDHTERFLNHFGAKISANEPSVAINGGQKLQARSFKIAGDISSAAFFMAAAALVRDSRISFESILFNPTRNGIFEVLKRMGAGISKFKNNEGGDTGPEPVADFFLSASKLKAFQIKKEELPSLIDEIPVLCVLATQAEGQSVIHDADELRVKESDRIESIKNLLEPMGADIRSQANTIYIKGPVQLKGAVIDSKKDHRIAMSGVVAGLIAEGETVVRDIDCIDTSFPTFFNLLEQLNVPYQFV